MVALRKASSYSRKSARPFTRTSKSRKNAYIKVNPHNKITKYNMGDLKSFEQGKHKFMVKMISEENVQIRDNALEACRTFLNKMLERDAPGQFYFGIKVFPHHILRENKTAAGAGADRLSSGMKHSYGIVIGRAARVNKGKAVLVVSCPTENVARVARTHMAKIKTKLPCKSKIVFEQIK